MIAIVWRYLSRPGVKDRFRAAYGPEGDWARLFGQAKGYLRTELLDDGTGQFVTLDYWADEAQFAAFQARFGEAYARLDAECEDLTEREEKIGVFSVAD